ncbi:tRNA modification GTPase [Candidatus Hakubella thermalkaliphila]|uniref:tRNA modification GTPase MnmE n=1 Tax=Candidatus Hakubella thermalkaliphila TaxID=2754717 RepID=A0A6V8QBI9_9ACTN|nr:tRNA uridine-5-carboxymethylaminomethyl(34) synthesis GTPase MnmE [Candidatus Hakubella thermalkaliphila]GFP21334.1 tRNA modification GTPase [Candidatus Hakubella thermalkaliphila]GFP32359.1 tRNA modification GTPase [Candidatus Hakubella thermalkaliphila]GFP41977.1 tRNA modification GTPase [Candidatus Hakubella thermalkaliphila]
MYRQDTIVAISTPIGEGAIGIVRMSGEKSVEIGDKLIIFKRGGAIREMADYSMSYGQVIDPFDGQVVDEVVVSVMRAPRSYTREDVVEINCHGGIVALKRAMDLAVQLGARVAEPGEFTKRAFLNGRIDLSQAEAVIDVIRAKTEAQLRAAMQSLEGGLSSKIRNLRSQILEVYAHLEVAVDFSDEDAGALATQDLIQKLGECQKEAGKLLVDARRGKILKEGVKVGIVGRPNVGKSSLLNVLLGERRAIVTPIPGTTRDVIEETINIQGVPFRLQDTAGIRDTGHEVEKMGVELSLKTMEEADAVLYVVDGSEPLTKEDLEIGRKLGSKKALVVVNKIDLPVLAEPDQVRQVTGERKEIRISATKGWGLEDVERGLVELVFAGELCCLDEAIMVNARQKELLEKAQRAIVSGKEALEAGMSEEFAAADVRIAYEALGEILGEKSGEDLLDRIFSEFCLGK